MLDIEEVGRGRFEQAWQLRLRHRDKPRISFTDLTSFMVMRELRITKKTGLESVMEGHGSRSRSGHVGAGEVLPFEKQRLSRGFREGIDGTVAKIEPRWMPALSKAAERVPGQ